MGICSFSAPQPIGVSFRFRKCKFSNNSRNAIQHSAVDMGSGLPAPARDFHRAGSPRLQASRWQIALLGILLEGLSGNRHRLPHQEPSHNRSPAVLRLISGHVLVHCPFREPMPPANVCHLSAAGTPTASWSSALSGCQCLLRLSATSAPRVLQPRPGSLPRASSEDYFPARCFSQAQAEARVSSIGRSAFQPSSFSARVGSAQMATTSPGRRGANL